MMTIARRRILSLFAALPAVGAAKIASAMPSPPEEYDVDLSDPTTVRTIPVRSVAKALKANSERVVVIAFDDGEIRTYPAEWLNGPPLGERLWVKKVFPGAPELNSVRYATVIGTGWRDKGLG